MSDSLWLYGSQLTRILCPWNSPKESLSTHYLESQNFNILLHVCVQFFLNFFRVDGMYHVLYPLVWVFLSNKDILLLTIVTEKLAFFFKHRIKLRVTQTEETGHTVPSNLEMCLCFFHDTDNFEEYEPVIFTECTSTWVSLLLPHD